MPTVETKLSRHGSLRSCFVGNRKEFFFYIYLFFSDDGKVVLSFYLEIDANDFTWNDNFRIWFSFMSLLYQSKTETINKYLGYRNNWSLLHNLSLLRVCALTLITLTIKLVIVFIFLHQSITESINEYLCKRNH